MSSRWLRIALAAALTSSAPPGFAAPAARVKPTGMIVFGIGGLQSEKGRVLCALFERDAWLKTAVSTSIAEIRGSTAVCRFTGVRDGRYAVAAFHDEDRDGELDKVLGIPSEPYCFSRDARGSFGPPSFDAASFRHSGSKTVQRARMK